MKQEERPNESPALEFKEVRYDIEDTAIIKAVTGQIPKGKVTALIGPSGAGKTTLLKLCNGLISPAAGDIYIEGTSINEQSPIDVRRHVGIVLQSSPMVKGTVRDNIALPLELRGQQLSEEQAVATMKRVGLKESVLDQDARDLSGGQQQKVSIARTLLNNSTILLLDEITSSLDPTSLQEIEQVIIRLHETENITIVWITHNLQQASRIGENFWVLVDGELRVAGDRKEVGASEDPDVRQFVNGVIS